MGSPSAARPPNCAGLSVLEMLITMGLISILAYTSMILVTAALRASAGTRDAEVGTDQMSVIRTDLGTNCAARLNGTTNPAAFGTVAVTLVGFPGGNLTAGSTMGDDQNLLINALTLEDRGTIDGSVSRLLALNVEFEKRSGKDANVAGPTDLITRTLFIRSPATFSAPIGACELIGYDPTNYTKLQTALPNCQAGKVLAANAVGNPICCFPVNPAAATNGVAQCQ